MSDGGKVESLQGADRLYFIRVSNSFSGLVLPPDHNVFSRNAFSYYLYYT